MMEFKLYNNLPTKVLQLTNAILFMHINLVLISHCDSLDHGTLNPTLTLRFFGKNYSDVTEGNNDSGELFKAGMIQYGLDNFMNHSRSFSDESTECSLCKILRTGYLIDSTARGKKHRKSQLPSGLMILGFILPTLLYVLVLMAKKALLSSMLALAVSMYALIQSRKPSSKQKYEIEGPLAPGSKFIQFKSNPGTHSNFEYPNIENIPIPNVANSPFSEQSQNSYKSPLFDDTKYFNKPFNQQEKESIEFKNFQPVGHTVHQKVRKPNQAREKDKEYHDYSPNQIESNSYEVTEINNMFQNFKPSYDNEYKFYSDQGNYNANRQTGAPKIITYDDREENHSYSNDGKVSKTSIYEIITRQEKENPANFLRTSKETIEVSNRPKYKTYQNSDSYRAESKKGFRGTIDKTGHEDQNISSSEINLKLNQNYSSKVVNNENNEDNSSSNGTLAKIVPKIEIDSTLKVESPSNEHSSFRRSQNQSTNNKNTDYNGYVSRPIIVKTNPIQQFLTHIRKNNTSKVPNKSENIDQSKIETNPVNQNFNNTDEVFYQNLEYQGFKIPSPVYKSNDKENLKISKSELALTYVPKIRTFKNNSVVV